MAWNAFSHYAARAVNSIFQRWGISATNQWNISGELCSGVATDATEIDDINPGIKCGCSEPNSTFCHITALRVYALDVVGPLPDELWNLTFLTNLNLGQNYLTGPLPASIGNLNRMQYLSLGINALSGELPNELGLLTDLRSLGFGTNNFSGPLPSELGNLTRLTQIYFDSAGVSGPIPPTFARLRSLERVWASDNELTGAIPDFIGTWSGLLALRLQGNSFQGSIPASFSNLTSLNDLRISDIFNGSSSLDFLRNMRSLSTLVLRNNNVSGSVPSFFSEFQSLSLLFLGNNRLTGALPSQRSPSLGTIDLSYNDLSGTFPSWVSGQNLQFNFVSNNFTIDNSNSSALSSGLNCLQRNFPCNRDSPIYSSFAVKCGGPQIRSSDQTVYEMDNATLGPATYFMTSTGRWAVSNVGLPADSSNPVYRSTSSSQFTNTLDSELFQTARVSAGSLRYYGLGLENGNYTVRLQFAETDIVGTRTWRSLGRRVFDIYVQGNRVLRDFDIRREANGISLRAVVREFRVEVLENHLDIHLFWAGKGTCCVPNQGTYGPLVSAISATPDFRPTVSNNPPSRRRSRTGMIVGIVVAVGAAGLICLAAVYYVFQKRRKQKNFEDEELLGIDARPYTFSYAELKGATEDFNPANKLGEGGFGPVYKVNTISIGYLAPEYAMRGHLTEKADVFSFGVVALEIVSGRPNSDPSLEDDKIYLLEWAWNLHENNKEIELVDPTLREFDANEVRRIIDIALLCTQASPGLRPSMSRVVAMLSGDIEVPSVTTRPGYLTDWKFSDATTFMTYATDDTSTSNTDVSHINSTPSTSMVADSPGNTTKPILHEIIGEGR
ncbi:hypothetical protein BUALT_Bualt18G0085600 [Buddleja alternifolia]|uniref:non-specific serine/threonine protein kinase n=1 Tax=Buddleja alternifolia TaxID=168488 RepID=A0AAV6W5D6_9LAMI|nr:hypothetical protein BUALT_Bualt18G0085600 [Buddleja alternifolia]